MGGVGGEGGQKSLKDALCNLWTFPYLRIDLNLQVGENDKVLMLLSGGVDSTVCASLVTKALGGDRVVAIHIDNGFMRKHESEQVNFPSDRILM